MSSFASTMARQPTDARWCFVQWLLGEVASPGVVLAAVVPFQLKVDVVLPTLRELRNADVQAPEAFLWGARHFKQELRAAGSESPDPVGQVLRDGLRRFPADVALARALAMHLIGIVEDNGHHLHESRYLGDPQEDLRRLSEARRLLPEADATHIELGRLELLLAEWRAFRGAGATDFAKWCLARNVGPPTGRAFYYVAELPRKRPLANDLKGIGIAEGKRNGRVLEPRECRRPKNAKKEHLFPESDGIARAHEGFLRLDAIRFPTARPSSGSRIAPATARRR